MNMQSAETARMLELINGFQVSRAVCVAAQLRLPDLIEQGQSTLAELACSTSTHAPSLLRLLRVLASVGVFEFDSDNRVAMTALARTLLSGGRHSLRGWAIGQLGDEHYEAWGVLIDSVRSGQMGFELVYGRSPWQHRAENPDSALAFDAGMSSFLQAHNDAIIEALASRRFKHLTDVGGGDGQLLVALLRAFPTMSATLLELPHVAPKAQSRLDEAGMADRCHIVAGSMFDGVPSGSDAYLLSRVIHDWDDEQALVILRNCRRAADAGTGLLLIERVLPDRVEPDARLRAVTVSDLNMLVMTGGRERTQSQYRELLGRAGWSLQETTATGTAVSLIYAVPA